jgi:hypothetical protein
MRRLGLLLLMLPLSLPGQGPAPPKNLKVLTPSVNIAQVMRGFTAGLGVECGYCHAQGDFSSDNNPKKEIARKMLAMMKQIKIHFPDAGNDFANSRYLAFPEGKQYVTCYTCHQGEIKPKFATPEPVRRAPEPYAPGAQGVGVPDVLPVSPPPQEAPNQANPNQAKQAKGGAPRTPVVNLQVLPRSVDLHIMELFRSSLGVECNFCHVAGDEQEKGHTGDRQSDANPKKLIARDMIRMAKLINEDLTGSGTYPDSKNVVTCWTCHRGSRVPPAGPARN